MPAGTQVGIAAGTTRRGVIRWRDCVRRSRSNLMPLSRRVQYCVSIRRRRSGGRWTPNARTFALYRH